MPNYNDAQGVADLLSQFDFNIISEGPGDFSPSHRKYTCEFSKPGIEPFTTTYQSNPDVHGQPTATDVFAALASGADAIEAHGSDEPVSLKAAVKEAREASVALAGDDTHENIGQDAR